MFDRRGVDPSFRTDAFLYDAVTDTYTCPSGKKLHFEGKEKQTGRINYK